MQEEVNQRTMALSIRASKLTGKVLAAAFSKVVRAAKAHHRKALTPKGRQSVAKLMNHYGAKNSMPYVGAPKDFDRIAKEFHVDYACEKVLHKGKEQPSILGQLRKFTELIKAKPKEKQRAREAVKDGR